MCIYKYPIDDTGALDETSIENVSNSRKRIIFKTKIPGVTYVITHVTNEELAGQIKINGSFGNFEFERDAIIASVSVDNINLNQPTTVKKLK